MIWIIIAILAVLAIWLYFKFFKLPKFGCIAMVTGGVKTGKSTLSVWFAVRRYKKTFRQWKIRCWILKAVNFLFRAKLKLPEEPVLYSNVKLAGVKYTLLTTDVILRKVRVAYKSVVYIQEASLLADSQYFKDMEVNERLLLFNKLFGHESHGGYLIYDTQDIKDNHYAVKRCTNSYFWIHHNVKIPFFCILYVREFIFSEDNSAVNTVDSDIEDSMKLVIVPKRVWKMFDCYCYSAFTDDLERKQADIYTPIPRNPFKRADLKTRRIISLKKFMTINEYKLSKEDEKNAK